VRLIIGIFVLIMLSGCFATGVVEKRGLSTAAADSRMALEISELWFRNDVDSFRNLSITPYNRRMLLTGEVASENQRADAVRLAWQVAGVREVINEIRVGQTPTAFQLSRDETINAELDSKLTFNLDVKFRNYKTRVRNGIVYVMGIASSKAEHERVINTARQINGVTRVVSYVEI
jgi:osmotically-inducible protein OsmY